MRAGPVHEAAATSRPGRAVGLAVARQRAEAQRSHSEAERDSRGQLEITASDGLGSIRALTSSNPP